MEILVKCYPTVLRLDAWLKQKDQYGFLTTDESDLPLLTSLFVCFHDDAPAFTWTSLSQGRSLHDLLMAAVEKLLRRNSPGGNLLTTGFYFLSSNPNTVYCGNNLESRYPNSLVNRLHFSQWQQLLDRVGDSVLAYLFESASMYQEIQGACFVQLTGTPLYNCELPDTEGQHVVKQGKNRKQINNSFAHGGTSDSEHKQQIRYLGLQRSKITRERRKPVLKRTKKGKQETKKQERPNGLSLNTTKIDCVELLMQTVGSYDHKDIGNIIFNVLPNEFPMVINEDYLTNVKMVHDQVDSQVENGGQILASDHEHEFTAIKINNLTKKGLVEPFSCQSTCTDKMEGSKTTKMESVHEKRGTQSLKRKRFDSNYEKQPRIGTKEPCLRKEDVIPVKETPAFKTHDYLQVRVGTSGVHVDASSAVGKRTKRNAVCPVNHTYRSTQAIDRKCILYVRNVREKFPKSSALSRLGDTSGSQLFSEVFTVLEATEGTKTRVVELLSEFGRKFRKGPTRTILTALCPLNKNATGNSVLTSKGCNISKLLQGHHHHRQVYLFVRACILRMFPEELIGGRHNRNVLLKNISKVISLGKYDKMSLGQLMSGIKTKNVQWLLSVECNRCRLDLMSRLVHWIITQFVFVLLRTHFYITDTTFLRYRLVYYRQATWTRLHIQGLTGLLHRKIMSPVSEMFVRNLVSSRAGLGISTLRFLPKQKSLRPIVNMGCPARILSTQPYLSVNQQLKDLHKVLTHLKDRTPRLVGSGKLGMNDIHASWAQYMAIWRQGGARKLYFVKTDISNCYDSIIQEKLVQIMESIIKEELQEECVVRKYFTFTLQGGQVRKTYQRHAAQLSNFIQDFTNFAKSQVIEKNLHGVVFVDKVLYQHLSTETVLQILRSHIFNNIVKVGRQYYLQNEGISQGSILSTLLCNFYYACMEHDHIALQSDELLMRVVDDYHFVSPSLERATGFLRTMLAGIKDYNCHTNVDKVMSNFSCSVVENQSIEYIETGWFPWCGLLFNMQTLEVAMDYTRYAGASIKDTMTFDFVREPGKTFKRKLIGSLRQKCHDMFLDPAVNSPSQIFTSVYHLFLLTMLKFHACARSLHVKQRVEDNPGFFYGVLKSVSYSMMRFLQKQQKACAENLNQSQLNASITWLCWKAFLVTYRLRLCFPRLTKLVKAGVVAVKKHLRPEEWELYDIALLKLSRPAHMTEYVNTICIKPDYTAPDHSSCVVAGWGKLSQEAEFSAEKPHHASVKIVPTSVCAVNYDKLEGVPRQVIDESVICANDAGRDFCEFDSGGPLACIHDGHWTLTGVVSTGNICGHPDYPGIYTRVNHFYDWIESVIEAN